jgi:hypothetical protein
VPVVRECERRVFELRRAQPLAATARTAGSTLAASQPAPPSPPSTAAAPASANEELREPTQQVRAALDAKTAALSELDQMIGIDSVKKQISGLCDVAIYDEMQRVNGVEPEPATHHMLFLGNPDTGKTTVAKIVSKMLKEIGIVTKDTVKMYDNARTALVDGVVGGTALKSAKVFKSARGGVLFLDEARHFDLHAAHLYACCAIPNPNPNPNPTLHSRTLSFPCPEGPTSHRKQSESCSRNPRSTAPTRS